MRARRAATITDEISARERILTPPRNLDFLLERRTRFLRDFLRPDQRVLEVGAGLGVVAAYVPGLDLMSTDARPKPWVSAAADAQHLPFSDSSFDAVVALHVLHHLPSPRRALREMDRVLRTGGHLLIAEPVASLTHRIALRATRHEYVDRAIDAFASDSCQTRPDFPGGGNNAIGDNLFGDMDRFLREFPGLRVLHHRFLECLTFMNSGGVTVRGPQLPLPPRGLRIIDRFDGLLMHFPRAFALAREVVFEKQQGSVRRDTK